ncbi:MAG: protein TolR [Deltaproteobacteria bacterium]|nr:protein TolR [Deltaproteobacteria bacterium]MBW2053078.1 protein TolR [Deltaproteobacteria bacterium]MBW2141626.1 protein TolR [Deltaproteobacteria bacterium]MBW2321904.1 protein TolR [Deltaproteobacteria bacterium]
MAFDLDDGNRRLMSDINVTPFVDVMLVLLIIFMVTAPMMMQGIDINLPQVDTKAIRTESERVLITLTAGGDVFIDEYKVTLKDLGIKVQRIVEARGTKEVFLRADRSIPYGKVARIMAEIRKAGVANLGLVTDPERIEPPKK